MYAPTYMKYLEQSNLWKQKVHWKLPGTGGRKGELLLYSYRVSFRGDGNTLELMMMVDNIVNVMPLTCTLKMI